jgi:CRP/FNR family cyclic AMP-dependent transcriptional regulator
VSSAELDELIVRLISGVDLFRHLERSVIVNLLRGASKAAFKVGEAVFEEGAEGRSLYIVVKGSFEVYRMVSGKRLRLAEISAGQHFGEIALLGGRRRTASVAALENSLAIRFSEKSFEYHPEAAALLYRNMANMLADRLLNADEEILFHRTARPVAPKSSAPSAPPIAPATRRIG